MVTGRRSLPYQDAYHYIAAVDMSGGSGDDAVLCIAHLEGRVVVIDLIAKQIGSPPFNPRNVVGQFCELLKGFHISRVVGDAYGGQTFGRTSRRTVFNMTSAPRRRRCCTKRSSRCSTPVKSNCSTCRL